ncbi:MAG: triose-phosphate isomerase [Myxococcota bacterium]|nr:triose-phosphate isomerase [Myxococcota bacterium]
MRTPMIAANFKMHRTAAETADYASALVAEIGDLEGVEIVVAPAFTALDRASQAFADGPVKLAAQDVNAEPHGAFTGEVSAAMLAEFGCTYAIVGHSERRALYGETNEGVSAKIAALLAAGLRPIVCIGESLEDREAGRSQAVVEAQLSESLAGVETNSAEAVVVAYEPVWAIGTGRTASPEIAQEAHQALRAQLGQVFGPAGQGLRILYGGSVQPGNASALLAQPDIDGALVGSASLDLADFASIVRAAVDS